MNKRILGFFLGILPAIAFAGASAGVAPWSYPSPPTNGQTWIYNSANGDWEPGTGGGGGATSVSNSDGSLTISPTTGAVVASLNTGNSNIFTAPQFISITEAIAQNAGFTLENLTPAAAGAQQFSPMLFFRGNGWGTTAPGSQSVAFGWQAQPVQGSAAPTGNYILYGQINGGSLTQLLSINSNNNTGATFAGNLTALQSMTVASDYYGSGGNVSFPTYSDSSNVNSGMYFPSTTSVAISQNGVQAILFSGSQAGTITGTLTTTQGQLQNTLDNAQVTNSTTTALPINTNVVMSFDTNLNVSPSSMHSTGTNPTRLIAASAGLYTVFIDCVIIPGGGNDLVAAYYKKNGAGQFQAMGMAKQSLEGDSVPLGAVTFVRLAANDYVEITLGSEDGAGGLQSSIGSQTSPNGGLIAGLTKISN